MYAYVGKYLSRANVHVSRKTTLNKASCILYPVSAITLACPTTTMLLVNHVLAALWLQERLRSYADIEPACLTYLDTAAAGESLLLAAVKSPIDVPTFEIQFPRSMVRKIPIPACIKFDKELYTVMRLNSIPLPFTFSHLMIRTPRGVLTMV